MNEIIVIGGGASGMMAAITAAEAGSQVLLLEQKEIPGKKLMMTGNGRCNFTNTNQSPNDYRGADPDFAWQVLRHFTYQDTLRFFMKLGIYSRNRNGYLYPYSDQAVSVVEALKLELRRLGVEIRTGCAVKDISVKKENGKRFFKIQAEKENFQAAAVILAAGSKAAPKSGSDGSGYALARKLGHTIRPVLPALVQLRCREKSYKQLAGIRTQAKITLYLDGETADTDTGELLFTEYGISGIPVFQVSRFASLGLARKCAVYAVLDFMPDFTEEQFLQFMKDRIRNHPERTAAEFFTGLFHKKLAAMLIRISGVHDDWVVGELSLEQIRKLCRAVKQYRTEIIGTNSFDQAQVCAGGAATVEIDADTMESRLCPGLYFSGEIVDVDGKCGGYNLQWAWTSGYVAGYAAAAAIRKGERL